MYESDIKIIGDGSGAINITSRDEAELAAQYLMKKFPNSTVRVDDGRRNFFVVVDGEYLSPKWLEKRGIGYNGFLVALGCPV